MSPAGGYDPAPVSPSGPGLSVRGGVGGIRFQWVELERAAVELGGLAGAVREVSAALLYLSIELERTRLAGAWFPGARDAGAAGRAAAEALDAARRHTSASGDDLQETADRITRARLAYLAADAAARAAVLGATESVELSARAAASTAAREGLLVPGPLALTAPAEVEQVDFGGTVEAVTDRLAAVEAAAPGSFEILRIDGATRPAYLVILPGTQLSEPGNPFDATGIAEAVNEDSRHVGAAVAQALREAGARPGDAVLLAGYSQGGMHAMNLAAGGTVGGTYDVRLVLTAGSPTGWEPTGTAEYLHLEHAADTVPALDGGPAPDEPNRVSVRVDFPVSTAPTGPGAEGKGLGGAHKLATYAQAAVLVDASALPSLAPAAAVLAATGGGARRHLYRAARLPAERPAAAPGGTRPTGLPGPPVGVPVPGRGEGPARPGPAGPPSAPRR
ncbi:hypothetical protein E2F48_08330 [Arthrobacter crusticola]|uniref:PE-PPE domain-containing protein n=1 Tax=Arthrobacter crusticola TaxID=2547960 RepID=A0A4R5TW20_9MICC|nr:hypothetical protein [Arthrobacter crusticola]TDK25278.1 hypothetical protein E2F48_08330 [Arthrobacter crusticola]